MEVLIIIMFSVLFCVAPIAVMFICRRKSVHIVCALLILLAMFLFPLLFEYVFLNIIGFALALISLVIIIFTDYSEAPKRKRKNKE